MDMESMWEWLLDRRHVGGQIYKNHAKVRVVLKGDGHISVVFRVHALIYTDISTGYFMSNGQIGLKLIIMESADMARDVEPVILV